MAKVHPLIFPNTNNDNDASCSTSTGGCSDNKYITSKREKFTVWMKSLVMQGNGCTAFDENGGIVYRIDNYDNKHSNKVYLMDRGGKLLFTVCEKKMCGVVPTWKGYKSSGTKPMFQVRKRFKSILGNEDSSYTINSGSDCYRLEGLGGKSSELFRVEDSKGGVVAEAKRKKSSSGVVLGDDVFTLAVGAHVDHSFIMALVTVYGLIRHQI